MKIEIGRGMAEGKISAAAKPFNDFQEFLWLNIRKASRELPLSPARSRDKRFYVL
jgi:hypothetical protein